MKAYTATGRRKTAVAQVRLISPGTGKFEVNETPAIEYFPVDVNMYDAFRPINVAQMEGKFDINVNVRGGGKSGQTEAIRLGIARALVGFDETLRHALREAGLLTRDPRMVERKKYGLKKARKRFQFSKR